jgi:mono/diheme cytochrome c family protein
MQLDTLWLVAPELLIAALVAGACSTAPLGASETGISAAKRRAPQGAEVFERECASCHGRRGEGLGATPKVIGGDALPRSERTRPPFETAKDLFDSVSTTMPLPRSRAGSLEPAEYWAVVNFMLVAHGSNVPTEGVTAENAASIPIAR